MTIIITKKPQKTTLGSGVMTSFFDFFVQNHFNFPSDLPATTPFGG